MARQELKAFPFDDPPRDQLLSRSRMGVSTFEFSVDLPETLRRRHFYLVAETGSRPILPQRLLGFVQYRFHPPAEPVLEAFYGRICLPVPDAVHDAGFVATSSVPLSWQQAPATLFPSGSATLVRLESGSSALPAPGLDAGRIEVKTAHILSSAELAAKYLFVRRVPDPECLKLCCEFTYDVYRWEPGLPVVASNAYGCDI